MPPESRAAGDGGVDQNLSVPRGGPIYVSDMVGSLTRVSDFEFSLVRELQVQTPSKILLSVNCN